MKLLVLVLQFLAGLFSRFAEKTVTPCPSEPRRKVSIRKVTDKEIDRLKDYADVFGLDNSMLHGSSDDLMQMGQILEGYVGEEELDRLASRMQQSFIASQTKEKSTGNSVLNAILQWAERIMVQLHVVKLHIKGGDKDAEGTING